MLDLNRVIAGSLRARVAVAALAVVVLVAGGLVAVNLPVDVLPDLDRPRVTLMTEAHGLVAEEVERLVTRPLEQALTGATGVEAVRSASSPGLSVLHVEFDWGTDVFLNRQIVQERLATVRGSLPPDVIPELTPVSSIVGQILHLGLRSSDATVDRDELRRWADTLVKPRLIAVRGVAQVVVIGGAPRQLQVVADARALAQHDVSLQALAEAVRAANHAASGGVLAVAGEGPEVGVAGFASRGEDLAQAVVRADAVGVVRVKDVAEVRYGPAAMRVGEAGIDGKPGVVLVVFKQPSVDTVDLTNAIHAELGTLRGSLPAGVEIVPSIFEQAAFVHRAMDNVLEAVRDGALLVLVVLFLFLLNLRTTFITLTAIPLSVAVTALVFRLFDLSINTMTLGGLAVAIGVLVDDAIVDVENIFRRLKENRAAGRPLHPLQVVYRASSEVRRPILVGTLLVVVVYTPLFALTGMEGRLFTPIGVAYVVSILASLAVSLTVTPVLSAWLLPNARSTSRTEDTIAVRHCKAIGGRLMALSCRHPIALVSITAALAASGCYVLATRGSEFLPPFNEGTAQVVMSLPPGASLETSDAFGRRLEQALAGIPGILSVGRTSGRGEGDEHAEPLGVSHATVTFDPTSTRTREEIIGDIRARIAAELPGVPTEVEQPLAHLLSHMLSGVNAQVAIKIFGDDLVRLRDLAQQAKAAIEGVPGVADLYVEPQVLVRRVEVRPRRDALARVGLSVEDVASTVEHALEGEVIDRLMVGQVAVPVVLRLRPEDRADISSIERLVLRSPTGTPSLLSEVADVELTWTPTTVKREAATRRIVVQHNVEGRALGDVVDDVDRALGPLRARLKPGESIVIAGQFEAQQAAQKRIVLLSAVALLAMFFILYAHYQSANLALQVLASIPMAIIGAVVAVVVTGQTVSIAVLVGIVSLAGIAARNCILLVDHYLHLIREEGRPFGVDTILRAGKERLVPVLMTAITAGIALVPIALTPDRPGRELVYPVATVILGGLVSSTLLDLLVTPGLFLLLGRSAAERHAGRPTQRDRVEEALVEDLGLAPAGPSRGPSLVSTPPPVPGDRHDSHA
jgi:CzcA family heavy metal efflux pump